MLLLMAGAAMSQGTFTCGEQVTDGDGNSYETVKIGGLCWTKSNMKSKTYSDGTPVSKAMVYSSSMYPDTNANLATYGRLYTWFSAVNVPEGGNIKPTRNADGFVQGICPEGWHIPTVGDMDRLNANSAESLRSVELWLQPNNNTNSTGFSSLPAGYYTLASNRFEALLGYTYYWSDSSTTPAFAIACDVNYFCDVAENKQKTTGDGVSVRCVKDCSLPTVSTAAVSNITDATADCGGEVIDDGGTTVTARGVCWSTSPNPTIDSAHTTDGSGTGSFGSNITGLTAGTTYYVRAYAINSVDTAYGNEVSFTTIVIDEKSCPEAQTVTDIESNVYATVKIGNQCWMRDNLRTTMYADSTAIAAGNDTSSTVPYYYDYNESGIKWKDRGYLYNWAAVMNGADTSNAVPSGVQGICPEGWHVPSDAEWTILEQTQTNMDVTGTGWRGDHAGKLAGEGWSSSTTTAGAPGNAFDTAHNTSGFSAVPAGNFNGSSFDYAGNYAFFWSSTQCNSNSAWHRSLYYGYAIVCRYDYVKNYGFSVRCLKDEDVVIDEKSCPEAKTVTDIEENVYATVKIGNQCWMRDNLRTTMYADSTVIAAGGSITSETYPYYYDYNESGIDLKVRGYLYNWAAVMNGADTSNAVPSGVQGICPKGWHVPSEAEWTQLTDYVRSIPEYNCDNNPTNIAKALADSRGWNSSENPCAVGDDQGTNNATGFSAVPAGWMSPNSLYDLGGSCAYFWSTATTSLSEDVRCREVCCFFTNMNRNFTSKDCGYSVRCLKDEDVVIDEKSCPEAKTVTDHEGNLYATVKIGNQCWMRDNLRTTTSPSTGAYLIPAVGTNSTFTGKQARWYKDSVTYAPKNYGLLYNWNAAVDTFNTSFEELSVNGNSEDAVDVTFIGYRRGICPEGWHLPSDSEWTQLTAYVSSQSEYICGGSSSSENIAKVLADSTGWDSYIGECTPGDQSVTANNATGFSAVPAGARGPSFGGAGRYADFWSSTQRYIGNARGHRLDYNRAHVGRMIATKNSGFSIRCLRDEDVVIDEKSCSEAKTVTDHEGNVYATVKIGNQCWTRDNLRTTTSPSTGTYLVTTNNTLTYTGKQARWYGNDSARYAPLNYGLLYNWNAAVDTFNTAQQFGETSVNGAEENAVSVTFTGHRRGICPEGWHLPSHAEWDTLTNYVSSKDEYICGGNSDFIAKALADSTGWQNYTGLAPCVVGNDRTDNNKTGFSAVPAGCRDGFTFYSACESAYFWSSTQYNSNRVWYRELIYDYASVSRSNIANKSCGFSVRCVKDNDAVIDEKSCREAKTVTDVDNNAYATVKIGNQCWMRQNLRTTKYADGTAIPAGEGNFPSNTEPYYYNYTSSDIDLNKRGYLYNWPAVTKKTSSNSDLSGVLGICPKGWHVPSDAEWDTLKNYVGSQSNYTCNDSSYNIAKALADTTGWQNYTGSDPCAVGNTQSDNNKTGFSAVPAGRYFASFSFSYAGDCAYFWSSTRHPGNYGWCQYLDHSRAKMFRSNIYFKSYGFSVRCVKDKERTLPTVTTAAVSNVTVIGATLGGEVTDDGGANVTVRGVCWSTSQNPTIADSHTTDGSGMGGFTVSIMGLVESTTYYVRAYAINSVDTAYGNEVSFTTPYFICGISQVTDVDKNFYNTVMIDKQCWMKENLRTTKYANGTAIPAGVDTSKTKPYYYDYTGTDIPLEQRGYLYNWPAVMNGAPSSNEVPSKVQGICPDGWHLPSDAEWIKMEKFVSGPDTMNVNFNVETWEWRGTHAGKLAGGDKWKTTTNINAPGNMNYTERNASGFSAVAAGGYKSSSLFEGAGVNAFFWSSTKFKLGGVYKRTLHYETQQVAQIIEEAIHMGYSVRCVRNGDEKSCPGTPTVTDIDGNVYATVQIGDQCWMRENLRTTKYPDGSSVTQGGNNSSGTEGFYYDYTIPIALKHRGYYYNWTAANNVCPNGWHLPSDEEWNTMEKAVSGSDWQDSYANTTDYRGTHAGKLAHEAGWENSDVANAPGNVNYTERNASGFSAVAAGGAYGELFPQSNKAYFWSSTPGSNNEGASCRVLYGDKAGVERSYYGKFNGYSVRCVKD